MTVHGRGWDFRWMLIGGGKKPHRRNSPNCDKEGKCGWVCKSINRGDVFMGVGMCVSGGGGRGVR